MLYSHDNLSSSPFLPASLSASDITALLPCDEADFAFGRLPRSRDSLSDPSSVTHHPSVASSPNRSLFASLIQAHHMWRWLGGHASRSSPSSAPWDTKSETFQGISKLIQWEESLPEQHVWSKSSYHEHKSQGLDQVRSHWSRAR